MGARMLGARGRVVQIGIGEAHVFLLTCAPWAKPNGSMYSESAQFHKAIQLIVRQIVSITIVICIVTSHHITLY